MPIRDLRKTSEISELAYEEINKIDQAILEAKNEVEEGAKTIPLDKAIERLRRKRL